MGGLASKLAVWALGKMAKGATKEAGEVIAKTAAKDSAVSLGESAAKTAVKETTEAAAKGATKEAAEATAKTAAKETVKETTEAVAKEATKEATEATAKTAGKEGAKGGFWYRAKQAYNAITFPWTHKKQIATAGVSIGAFGVGGKLAWDKLVNDKDVLENLGAMSNDAVMGLKDGGKDFGRGFINGASQDPDVKAAAKVVDDTGKKVKETAEDIFEHGRGVGNMLSEIVNTIGSFFGGVSNMLSSLTNGKVGGLGVVGLLASAYLIFGRTGILGKIGGLLMGMTLLSGIMRPSENVSADQSVVQNRGKNDTMALDETAQQQAIRR